MYFNVITLLVQRVTKLISLYYNDNKVSIYLSIYLSITVVGGRSRLHFRVLLSRFNLQQFNVKLLLFFILFEFPFQATTIQLLLTK